VETYSRRNKRNKRTENQTVTSEYEIEGYEDTSQPVKSKRNKLVIDRQAYATKYPVGYEGLDLAKPVAEVKIGMRIANVKDKFVDLGYCTTLRVYDNSFDLIKSNMPSHNMFNTRMARTVTINDILLMLIKNSYKGEKGEKYRNVLKAIKLKFVNSVVEGFTNKTIVKGAKKHVKLVDKALGGNEDDDLSSWITKEKKSKFSSKGNLRGFIHLEVDIPSEDVYGKFKCTYMNLPVNGKYSKNNPRPDKNEMEEDQLACAFLIYGAKLALANKLRVEVKDKTPWEKYSEIFEFYVMSANLVEPSQFGSDKLKVKQ